MKLTRIKFIESHGATCKNPSWSWSFINEKDKLIIFGTWEEYIKGNRFLLLSEDWEFNKETNRKKAGYPQSREHIRLIEEEGYTLKIFIMKRKAGSTKIKSFEKKLITKSLMTINEKEVIKWYAE